MKNLWQLATRDLSTPIQRAGFIVFSSGLLLLLIALAIAMKLQHWYIGDAVGRVIEAVFDWDSMHVELSFSSRYGALLLVIGWLLSYGFRTTIAKVIAWIRHG
jgi:hypothetical protein